jgi:hypothetical protein
MSRKQCKRKHWALVDPIAHAIVGASIPSESRLDKLRIKELSAIESFAKGNAGPSDFRDICDLLNVAQGMGEEGIGPEALPVCDQVECALLRVKTQYENTNSMILRANELKSMRDLYEIHDLQRTAVDLSTYERSIRRVVNQIKGKHPSVKVLV